MKAYSSILLASLFQSAAHAAEHNEKPHLRRATEAVESQTLEKSRPHKHEPRAPRGEKKSQLVTYFTMGGNNEDNHDGDKDVRTVGGEKKPKPVNYFTIGGNKADAYDGDKDVRIVGGSQSSVGEFPYYVDLNGGCGGSLIAPNVVLSAAHCGSFQGQNVIVGAYRAGSTQNNAVRVRVTGEVRHPNYDDFTLANDFLLLRLAEDVTVGGSDVVLSINDQFSSPANGEALTVLGLGLTSEQSFNTPNKLRDVEIKAIPTNVCNQQNAYGGDVEGDIMLCAGVSGGGKDSCQGDSGGPLVKRVGNQHILVGVVSWGDGCARPNKPGVYARVSSAFNWIQQVACNQWNSDADFCGNSAPNPPSPTAPSPAPPSPSPVGSGGGGEGNCSPGEMFFDFTIRTDDYGEETSWKAVNSSGQKILGKKNLDSNRSYRESTCIPDGCYTLKISDTYGDGLGSGGRYEFRIDGDLIEKRNAFDFGDKRSIEFGSCNGGGSSGGGSGVGSGNCPGLPIALNLRTDDHGSDTDLFLLTDEGDLIWNANGFANNKNYRFEACLDRNGCTTLDIFDYYGDGILSPGFIKVSVDDQVAWNSGDVGRGIIFRIGDGC